LEFRAPLKTSAPLQKALAALRKEIPVLEEDRYLAPDLANAAALVAAGTLSQATEIALPTLS
ncbi:MAG: histidine ammonia-lyase, partial [Rhodobacterales bacterium]